MKMKHFSVYYIHGGIFHNNKRLHISWISFISSLLLVFFMTTYAVYNSLTLNTLTGLNAITEFMNKEVFQSMDLITPKLSDVNSDHMLGENTVGLFPLHVFTHDMGCADISYTIYLMEGMQIKNSTKLQCHQSTKWKDIHSEVPQDFMKVVYDEMTEDYDHKTSV